MVDYVQEVLDFLDSNWNTGNYDPKPELIDQRDAERTTSSGPPSVDFDLTTNNAITVGDRPLSTFTPADLGWENTRVEYGCNVRIEAADESEYGYVADAEEFGTPSESGTLVGEAARALRAERRNPLPGYNWLEVRQADGQSTNYKDYYRTDLEVYFVGREALP